LARIDAEKRPARDGEAERQDGEGEDGDGEVPYAVAHRLDPGVSRQPEPLPRAVEPARDGEVDPRKDREDAKRGDDQEGERDGGLAVDKGRHWRNPRKGARRRGPSWRTPRARCRTGQPAGRRRSRGQPPRRRGRASAPRREDGSARNSSAPALAAPARRR